MKVWFWKVGGLRPDREYTMEASLLNTLVEAGYDLIVIVGPSFRLTSSIEDWLDYAMADLDGDVDVVTLRTNRMEKA